MNKKDKQGAVWVAGTIFFLAILIFGSLGWLLQNYEEVFGPFFEKEEEVIVVPTLEPPLDDESAALIAECQDQLEAALVMVGPVPDAGEREFYARYLEESRIAQVKMRDLITRGRLMYDELRVAIDDEDIDGAWVTDWERRSYDYRDSLIDAVDDVRYIGMSDSFVRVSSEIFLAYHYIDLFSDDINDYFGGVSTVGVDDLNQAELHLNTARDYLNR